MSETVKSFNLPSLTFYISREKKAGTPTNACISSLFHVWACLIMQIIACSLHWSRQKGLMPLFSEMTTTVSSLTWIFGFTCWHFCYCYLMAPPHLPSEADSQGVLDRSPAVLKDLLNMIPVWRSSSVLAPRFPGESQAGKLESPPPPRPSPHHHCFSYRVPISFVLLGYPHTPRLLSPLFTVSEPGRSLFFAKWVLFKIMFDAVTGRTKTV